MICRNRSINAPENSRSSSGRSFSETGCSAVTVTITHRGALIQTIRLTGLTETKTVAIDGDYHLEIQVDSGGVCVTRSDCPGQDCVHTGRITRSGQSIVCLPEQVVIQLTGGTSDADVVLG